MVLIEVDLSNYRVIVYIQGMVTNRYSRINGTLGDKQVIILRA